MVKLAVIGALAPLLLLGGQLRAEWRTPIVGAQPMLQAAFTPMGHHAARPLLPMPGAKPMLPSRFTPMGYEVIGPLIPAPAAALPRPIVASLPPSRATEPATRDAVVWSLPLVDRRLTLAERTADIAPELQEAITRIEPMYDPTRLDGPNAEAQTAISSGTAAMNNVFADRWRMASPDANINVKVADLATAWQMKGDLPCDAFFKNRPHGFGDPSLTALSLEDCRALRAYEALPFDAAPPVPVAGASVTVPVFAAPLPGSRMSSQDFWVQQKARIAAIQARLHDKWQSSREQVSDVAARP